MTTKNFMRRVQRLEQRVLRQDEPFEITIEYVGMDGQIESSHVVRLDGRRTWTKSDEPIGPRLGTTDN